MRKLLTMLAALLVAVGLMVPAYATEATNTDPGEYTESQQYVYLVQGANLYLGPDTSYDVYATAESDYNEKILISGYYENGWVRYQKNNSNVWLYVAPEDLIWDEDNAYTVDDYLNEPLSAEDIALLEALGLTVLTVLLVVFGCFLLDSSVLTILCTVGATGSGSGALYILYTSTLQGWTVFYFAVVILGALIIQCINLSAARLQ